MCKYDSNKIEHNKTVKLPPALSVVAVLNTPLLLMLFNALPTTPPFPNRDNPAV